MACKGTNRDGSPCAMPNGKREWCFAHDPSRAEEVRKARTKGGLKSQEAKKTDALLERLERLDVPEMNVTDETSVIRAVQDTINRLRRGEEEPEVARAIGQLLSVALKARAQADTDDRLKKLEEQMRPLKEMDAADLLRALREGQRAVEHDA